MQKEYPITYQNVPVGTARVRACGLYYEILCECKLKQKQLYRLYARVKNDSVSLGILAPKGNHFFLRKKIAAKEICIENCTFYVTANERFVVIDTSTPFAHLADIESGRLVTRDQVAGIVITDRSQVPQDNGPSP